MYGVVYGEWSSGTLECRGQILPSRGLSSELWPQVGEDHGDTLLNISPCTAEYNRDIIGIYY